MDWTSAIYFMAYIPLHAISSSPMPKYYTIPTIDLAHETHRQVIIDRESGQYLGHPTTVLLEDNRTMITARVSCLFRFFINSSYVNILLIHLNNAL